MISRVSDAHSVVGADRISESLRRCNKLVYEDASQFSADPLNLSAAKHSIEISAGDLGWRTLKCSDRVAVSRGYHEFSLGSI